MTIHNLKIDLAPFNDLLSGKKTGEVRNDDRGFEVGDTVSLTCTDGRTTGRTISHIQRGYGLPEGICVLSYTRAVPDVPELVRYRLNSLGELVYSENGSYALHSQAAEIIAAKDKEINKLNVYNSSYHNQITELRELLQAAEAKLAQYEAQEPVAWRHPDAGWTDVSKAEVAVHCKHGTHPQPLYTSPAPAADLKAENERLREALTKLLDAMPADTLLTDDELPAVADARATLILEASPLSPEKDN